jgi:hypothetical protein
MRAWAALGFTPCATVEEHVLGLEQLEPRLGPLVARLRQQRRIPAGARVISLYEADADAVLRLHLDNLGGDRADLYRRLRGTDAGAFHPRYSRVLTIDGKVKGCILGYRVDKENAAVDAVVVDPSVRSRWASVWLRLEATRGALRWGIKNVQFTTFDHYTDTRRFAKKLGGVTTRTTVLVIRPVAEVD